MYTFGLDADYVCKVFKWTLRVGMTLSVLFAVIGGWSFFQATWLIFFPSEHWNDARVQNLLVMSGFMFGAGLYLYKNMWGILQALHPDPPRQGALLMMKSDQ